MPIPSPATILSLWHRALAEEIGIAVSVPEKDRRWLLNSLYALRKESGDERLEALMIVVAWNNKELWLIKKAVEMEE